MGGGTDQDRGGGAPGQTETPQKIALEGIAGAGITTAGQERLPLCLILPNCFLSLLTILLPPLLDARPGLAVQHRFLKSTEHEATRWDAALACPTWRLHNTAFPHFFSHCCASWCVLAVFSLCHIQSAGMCKPFPNCVDCEQR